MTEIKNPVPHDEQAIIWPLVGKRMLELGNKKNKAGTYKAYFESIGIDHTSIDWNGLDGALKLDLREPIDLEPFDMVTNIGTTEHVDKQEPVWRNIHNLTKIGGVICSLTPARGHWWWHGQWYPDPEFFEIFASLNGYKIEFLGTGREYPNLNVMCRMKKVYNLQFEMPSMKLFYFNEVRPR